MKRKKAILDKATYWTLKYADVVQFDENGELWLIYNRVDRGSSAKRAKDLKWGSTKVQDIIDARGFIMKKKMGNGIVEYEVNNAFIYIESILLGIREI